MEACWAAAAPKDAGGGITLATPIFFINNDEECFRKYQDCGYNGVSRGYERCLKWFRDISTDAAPQNQTDDIKVGRHPDADPEKLQQPDQDF